MSAIAQDVATQRYISLNTAIERYDVSRGYLYKLRTQGRISIYSLGSAPGVSGRSYIDVVEFENLIAEGKKAQPKES
jgi:hypothetical protein